MIAQVLIDGGSTAQGWGDETGKGGFAGRIFNYTLDHLEIAREHPELACRWIQFRNSGEANKTLPSVAESFVQHVDDARSLLWRQSHHEWRSIAVFAIGYCTPGDVKTCGTMPPEQSWEYTFDGLVNTCFRYGITPIFLGTPRLADDVVLGNGKRPDHDLLARLAAKTVERAKAWEELEDPYIPFEDIVGDDKPNCMAPDGMHPNARGHSLIARYLIGRINTILDIPEGLVPLPEVEPHLRV